MKHLKSITRTCASLAVILLAGCNTNFKEFEALIVNRSGSFELDMIPEYASAFYGARRVLSVGGE